MNRYSLFHDNRDGIAELHDDVCGEWVRYSDHCEAMKRIAGDPRMEALAAAEKQVEGAAARRREREATFGIAAPPAAPVAQQEGIRVRLGTAVHEVMVPPGYVIDGAQIAKGNLRFLTRAAPVAQGLTDEQIDRVRALWLDPEKCDEEHALSYNSALEDAIDALTAQSAVTEPLQGTQESMPLARPGRWRDGDACEPAAPAPVGCDLTPRKSKDDE